MIKIICFRCGCKFDVVEVRADSTNAFYECPNCGIQLPAVMSKYSSTWVGIPDFVEHIELLINQLGTDRLYIHTTMPSTFPPGVSNDHMIVGTEVQKGKALRYACYHFPDKHINVIDASNGQQHWVTPEERKKILEKL